MQLTQLQLKRMIREALEDEMGSMEDEGPRGLGKAEPASGGKKGFRLKSNKLLADAVLESVLQHLDEEWSGLFEIMKGSGLAGIRYIGGRRSGNRQELYLFPEITEDHQFAMLIKGKPYYSLEEISDAVRKAIGEGEQ